MGDPDKNGRWFAVFGSGPQGPIDATSHQFLARSDQPLRFFVVDLRTGSLVATLNTPVGHAFAGSLAGAGIDADRWSPSAPGHYQDDAVYAGYVKQATDGSWSDGGVGRIAIDPVATPNDPNVANIWHWSTVVDGIGPVSAGLAKLQDRKNHQLWLYLGTGRYFYNQDDMTVGRALFGIKEPCYNPRVDGVDLKRDLLDPTCSAALSAGALADQTCGANPPAQNDPGWRIDLDPGSGSYGPERLVSAATSITGGAVFFPTFQPSKDVCQPGDSYLWGVQYDSGGALPDGSLRGQALVQLSTGGLQKVGLSSMGGRRSAKMTGRPGSVKIVSNSGLRPLKKIIHIQER